MKINFQKVDTYLISFYGVEVFWPAMHALKIHLFNFFPLSRTLLGPPFPASFGAIYDIKFENVKFLLNMFMNHTLQIWY